MTSINSTYNSTNSLILYLVSKILVNNGHLDKNKDLFENLRLINKTNNNYLKNWQYKIYYFCDYHTQLHNELYRKFKFSTFNNIRGIIELNKDKKILIINNEDSRGQPYINFVDFREFYYLKFLDYLMGDHPGFCKYIDTIKIKKVYFNLKIQFDLFKSVSINYDSRYNRNVFNIRYIHKNFRINLNPNFKINRIIFKDKSKNKVICNIEDTKNIKIITNF